MFESCTSILSLDLSNFNTEMVINMDRMFSSCLKLEEVDLTSFKLTNCNSTESMFTNTTRELMLSIEKNEEVMIQAGFSWTEKETDSNDTKIPLDLLFLVDATGSMMGAIEEAKREIVYIAVNLMKKKGMENYVLSLAAIFYRDPIDSYYDIHEIFDFDKNALNFKNFTMNIRATGGADGPEDWAGAFNLAKNLSWQNDSLKFIIHIFDAPGHGTDYVGGYDKYPGEGNKTDEILTYFAKNNFSIAGFETNNNYG
jgi:surface protein